jgi:acyl-coenzyme A synthetase/AMP-(fatty) acid ligase
VLTDTGTENTVLVPAPVRLSGRSEAPPQIPAGHVATIAFTSGTTGDPVAHPRLWEQLFTQESAFCERLELGSRSIVATVPSQHTYGLETTALSAFVGGAAIHWTRPLFPRDVGEALASVPEPRVLVTTPFHLKALVQSQQKMPSIERVVSATGPLGLELAAQAELLLEAPVYEVYGSTETGGVASRRTTESDVWRPMSGLTLMDDGLGFVVQASHLPVPIPLPDHVELCADGGFRLLGRRDDVLKIAGIRTSLAELSRSLLAIPGVEDAAVLLQGPQADTGLEVRAAALVVAPTLSVAEILDALAHDVDPALLPRPLRRVVALPRNELGKLVREDLRELLQS